MEDSGIFSDLVTEPCKVCGSGAVYANYYPDEHTPTWTTADINCMDCMTRVSSTASEAEEAIDNVLTVWNYQ